ncbi:MAG: transporter [Deltaproteobacteria bacterium]|nr:transporter [Deltaproteobacteria bacterium]
MKSKAEAMEAMKDLDSAIHRTRRFVSIFSAILAIALILFSINMKPAMASEGGWSSYTPGTYGDFSMNYAAPGLYFRENVVYFKGKLDDMPVMPGINANLKQTTWFNLLGITYVAPQKILGANYFITTNIPYGFSAKLEANVPAFGLTLSESVSGFGELGVGDVWIAPIGLMWNIGSFHITLTENIVLPTGKYDPDNLINMGRNYTSYDTDIGFTWLDEKNGHEVSLIAGYLINSTNHKTDYKTGNEFHVDFALNQFFSERFAVGITGYYYQQVTDDSGSGVVASDGYKSSSAGVGPAVFVGLTKDIQIMGKWIWEYHAKNRFKGNWATVSLVVKF